MTQSESRARRELTSSANALAGGIASTIATILTYPFDLIRTRFQGLQTRFLSISEPFTAQSCPC
jgi:hypothetical protein